MEFKFSGSVKNIKESDILMVLDKAESIPGIISFAAGMPAPELFPVEEIKSIFNTMMDKEGMHALQYGPTEGHVPLRVRIAAMMTDISVNCTHEDILITSGSQQALDLIGKAFLDPGDVIICESPTYMGAISAFDAYQPRYVTVGMDENGIIAEELEHALKENQNAKFLYLIPDFQNPTGITLSLERRQQVITLAERYGVPIVEDSPYNQLRFDGEALPPIKRFDRNGVVIYLGTMSKILCPGFRIGWICADKSVIKRCVNLKIGLDLQTSLLLQRLCENVLREFDVKKHIETIRALYKKRRDVMLDAIRSYIPGSVQFTEPAGGLFIWMTFPEGVTSKQLVQKCLEEKVLTIPGDAFFPYPSEKAYLRLNYSFMPEDRIVEGIKRLGRVVQNL